MRKIFVLVIVFFMISLASASQWGILDQTDFNQGTYENTTWDTDHVELSGDNATGTYVSQVFDAGQLASWDSLNWSVGDNYEAIFFVTSREDIYRSSNAGSSWTAVNTSFSGDSANAVEIISDNDGYLYLVDLNENIWNSTDLGVSWTKVRDDYNGGEGEDAKAMTIDTNGYIYIFEDDENVWRSTDGGYIWAKIYNDFDDSSETSDARGAVRNSSGAIFVIAGNGDVYASADLGVSWTELTDDYGGGYPEDMTIDTNDYMYVVDGDDIWQSVDGGFNWDRVNSALGGNGDIITADVNNLLYVIDDFGYLYRSSDSGVSWTKLDDLFDSGDGLSMTSVNISPNIKLQIRSDDDNSGWGEFVGPDGTASTYYTNSVNLAVPNNTYFQYAVFFETSDTDYSPELYNLTFDYTLLDVTSPTVTIHQPTNTEYTTTSVPLNVSADENVSEWWYSLDLGVANTTFTPNTTITASKGNNTLIVYAADTSGNEGSANISFTVDETPPEVSLLAPSGSYSSRTGIPLTYTVSDSSPITCTYNVTFAATDNVVLSDANITGCGNITFSVSVDGDYTLRLRVSDTASNFVVNTTSFSVSTRSGGYSSGGSGSGRVRTKIDNQIDSELTVCVENWRCEQWYGCIEGIQARNCVDVNKCGTTDNKPKESVACDSTEHCFDKIQNYDEEGIDCGGSYCNTCYSATVESNPAFLSATAASVKSMFGSNSKLIRITSAVLVFISGLLIILRSFFSYPGLKAFNSVTKELGSGLFRRKHPTKTFYLTPQSKRIKMSELMSMDDERKFN